MWSKTFGILFILTGIFAVLGGAYTWGDGSILEQNDLVKVLIPWADIVLTGPVSLLAGIGVLKRRSWGRTMGLVTAGIYLFGTALVVVSMVWNSDYSIFLIVPATSGLLISIGFIVFTLRKENATGPG